MPKFILVGKLMNAVTGNRTWQVKDGTGKAKEWATRQEADHACSVFMDTRANERVQYMVQPCS